MGLGPGDPVSGRRWRVARDPYAVSWSTTATGLCARPKFEARLEPFGSSACAVLGGQPLPDGPGGVALPTR